MESMKGSKVHWTYHKGNFFNKFYIISTSNKYTEPRKRFESLKWFASGNAKVAEESKKKFQAIQEAYSGSVILYIFAWLN